ncbi:cysteine proteinase [Dothidotthia symphoricarpi CBS 119687]|uniref:ubiquitinyl hydrolase 1 n=1 Tax=Dothidotthia symphoricarpi CBS 119687 TaxID=1392245 RepID=A0A6A6AJP3_9PLEO|nr:cysteine proteinase [Dothidotthia symphoricarpi CBS 119687]KAF2132169.1 cysteine proteinase [Dothidotthia symphoricarpi CBS 119687]
MADPAYTPTDEELAHLQKLSSEYEPEATGPLVGERQSSAAITTQYATADPVYRIKTAALPAKYAYFRTCRGDGHCGWRAIAFTYFEALLRVGDANKLEDEEARLNSMGNLLDHIGYPRDIWMDFAEEAFELLRTLANSLHAMDGAAPDILLRSFNDLGVSMAIITYFKLLASAWVQSHADDFGHFVPMGDVKAYCANNIEPAQCEADNIGVAALADALVKPAGFGLEVWYLDRSPGEEINRSYFAEPTDHNNMTIPGAPMLRLLYRPGHYDILYKAEDVPQPIQHQPIHPQSTLQVNLANYSDDFVPAASNVADVMTMIPGMFPTGLGQRWPSLSCDFNPSPVVQPQITACQPYPSAPASATRTNNPHFDFVSPIHSSPADQYNPPGHHNIQLEQPPMTLPIHPPPPATMSAERTAPLAVERGGPFRPSMYELEPGFGFLGYAQPFQTSIFRNSHFNTAHFMNPEFQPEEWCPDGEYTTSNRGRHKSHSS